MNSATEQLAADDARVLATKDFARISGLQEAEVRELLDYQLLPARLDTKTALAVREASQQRKAFDLDLFTTGLLARYLLRIEELDEEVRHLRAERPACTVYTEVSYTSVQVRSST
jgi:hypothetical protein